MSVTPLALARKMLGLYEIAGEKDHPFIQWCHSLCNEGALDVDDEVPWCSAFAQFPSFLLDLPRSKSRMARSWLSIGSIVKPSQATPGSDIVILKRGGGDQPGPEVLNAPGHVGFFDSFVPNAESFRLLGGNQGNKVSIAAFPLSDVLGVRRLA